MLYEVHWTPAITAYLPFTYLHFALIVESKYLILNSKSMLASASSLLESHH